jgi:hypothetical protein
MSNLLLFSVFDSKLGEYNSPMVFPSRGVAFRSFLDEAGRVDPSNAVNKHPEDFSLYHVGTFDSVSGTFVSLPTPDLVVRASDFEA